MLVDTHCHLNFGQFKNNWQEVAKMCLENNIWMVVVGCDFVSSRKAVEVAAYFDRGVFSAVGVHPTEVDKDIRFEDFLKLAQSNKNVAIGEVGFDFWYQPFDLERQREILAKFIELAKDLNLPVIFHLRSSKDKKFNAHKTLLEFIEKFLPLRAVVHSFDGTIEEAEKFISFGFYIGVNGLVTKSKKVAKVIKKIPLEKLLLETDSPYLLPSKAEGKINIPCNVKYVAEKVASLKKIPLELVEKQTTLNARDLFLFKTNLWI